MYIQLAIVAQRPARQLIAVRVAAAPARGTRTTRRPLAVQRMHMRRQDVEVTMLFATSH